MWMIILLSVLLAGDLILKNRIETKFSEEDRKEFLEEKILVRKFHNPGMAMGKLPEYAPEIRKLCSILTGGVIFQWLVLLTRRGKGILKAGVTCVLAGALSNLADRYVHGYVVDFISIQVDRISFVRKMPGFIREKISGVKRLVFNFGDLFIAIGSILVIAFAIERDIRKKKQR